MTDLTDFLETAQKLADEAEEGRRIKEAAQKGYVDTTSYVRQSDANEDERLREMAREVIFETWHKERRPASLNEVYEGVLRKIAQDIDDGAWPRIWNAHPLKRTVDRRTGELHEMDYRFWGPYTCPPCLLVRPGYNQPNPMLFDDSTRAEIAKT